MKNILRTLICLFSLNLFAQVTLSVGAIEVDQSVTITLDTNSTDSNCNGFNNPTKVYMHSGIGDNSNAFGFSVIGNYGQDDGIGQMTSNGDGTYSITITPQTYYGLTQMQADAATQIGMVFRILSSRIIRAVPWEELAFLVYFTQVFVAKSVMTPTP